MNEILQNEENIIRASNFLLKYAQSKGIDLPANRMKPTPSVLYIRSKYSAGGRTSLLTGNVTSEVGVTNFDGNTLSSDRYVVFNGVSIRYGEGNSTDAVYNIDYSVKFPPVLLASQLLILQKNEVVTSLPIVDIVESRKADDFYRKLGALALLEPLAPIDIAIDSPTGSSITPTTGNTSFVEISLNGFETYLKR